MQNSSNDDPVVDTVDHPLVDPPLPYKAHIALADQTLIIEGRIEILASPDKHFLLMRAETWRWALETDHRITSILYVLHYQDGQTRRVRTPADRAVTSIKVLVPNGSVLGLPTSNFIEERTAEAEVEAVAVRDSLHVFFAAPKGMDTAVMARHTAAVATFLNNKIHVPVSIFDSKQVWEEINGHVRRPGKYVWSEWTERVVSGEFHGRPFNLIVVSVFGKEDLRIGQVTADITRAALHTGKPVLAWIIEDERLRRVSGVQQLGTSFTHGAALILGS